MGSPIVVVPAFAVFGQNRDVAVVDEGEFIGRALEKAQFAELLADLRPGRRSRLPAWLGSRTSGERGAPSPVVLVYGLAGTGKRRLLEEFKRMADGGLPGVPAATGQVGTVRLDWASEQLDHQGSYSGADGPPLLVVLNAIQTAMTAALPVSAGAERAFSDYRQGAARMPEYVARFAELIAQGQRAGSGADKADLATLARSGASAVLAVAGHPAGIAGLTPDQLVASGQALGHLSQSAVRAVTGKKPGEITQAEYDLVTDPARELTRRVAAAVRATAARLPLVIFFNRGEIIGGAWPSLRRVMTLTGPSVIWLIGARFAAEADAGPDSPIAQFRRDIGTNTWCRCRPAHSTPQRFSPTCRAGLGCRRTSSFMSVRSLGSLRAFRWPSA